MPKKTKSKTATTTPTQENALSFSSANARAEFLQEKHKKLLKQIKSKKTELSNLTEQMQTIAQEMLHVSRPFYEKIQSLDKKIHALFDKILSNKRLGKRQKKEIIGIYKILQITGRISPRIEHFTKSHEELIDEEEQSTESDFFGREPGFDEDYKQIYEQENISQSRPNRDLRKLFLKLADKFHPDKASDDESRVYYTEIMKEINIAYKGGDLARLLEIEKEENHEKVKFFPNDINKECERLEIEINLLSQQYEQIKAEVREVRNTPQGNMVKHYRKAKRSGENLMAELIKDAELELNLIAKLHDFVKAFQQRKITLHEFLRGPNSGDMDNMEDMVNEMFEDMFIVINY
ncbi:MAG: J domain-containing protein [Microcoleaceae cyanobacterium MO_207.B10]|nr:J domain-containing protein [Microcoleaceae cyanobacterium MO_207.B10]